MTNITPQTVKHWLAAGLPTARAVQAVAGSWVRGSFPSGHTFRATYVTEALAPRSPVVRWLVPLAVAAAVVATGGHWPWDTVGGWLLAQTLNPRARRRA
jgi:membrane-associated phospholipid phosphatase